MMGACSCAADETRRLLVLVPLPVPSVPQCPRIYFQHQHQHNMHHWPPPVAVVRQLAEEAVPAAAWPGSAATWPRRRRCSAFCGGELISSARWCHRFAAVSARWCHRGQQAPGPLSHRRQQHSCSQVVSSYYSVVAAGVHSVVSAAVSGPVLLLGRRRQHSSASPPGPSEAWGPRSSY